jgi:hypothetical protein
MEGMRTDPLTVQAIQDRFPVADVEADGLKG